MNIKYDPRMKKMKISHIMRVYKVTYDEAQLLRAGNDLTDKVEKPTYTKPAPKPAGKSKPTHKESE